MTAPQTKPARLRDASWIATRAIDTSIPPASDRRRAGIAPSPPRGVLIQFLDADDVILPEKIQRQVEALGRGNGLQVAHCDYFHGRADSIMEPDRRLRMSPLFIYRKPMYDLALRWETELSIPIHCFLFDARIFRDHGVRFDETCPITRGLGLLDARVRLRAEVDLSQRGARRVSGLRLRQPPRTSQLRGIPVGPEQASADLAR